MSNFTLAPSAAGTYQLVALLAAPGMPYFDNLFNKAIRPCIALGMMDTYDGRLDTNLDAPIPYDPNFLIQGKRDFYGDRDVQHGRFRGSVTDTALMSKLGCTVSFFTESANTCGYIDNRSSTTYMYKYKIGFNVKSTAAVLDHRLLYPYLDSGQWKDSRSYTYSINLKRCRNTTFFEYTAQDAWYTLRYIFSIKSDIALVPQDHFGNYPSNLPGYYSCTLIDHRDGDREYKSSGDNSGMRWVAYTPPINFNDVSDYIRICGRLESSQLNISAALQERIKTWRNDLIWEAAHAATKSSLYLDFAWAEFIKELPEFPKLIKPFLDFKQGRSFSIKRLAEYVLWWTYGIQPLVSDADALIVAQQDTMNGVVAKLTERAKLVQSVYGTKYTETPDTSVPNLTWNGKVNIRLLINPVIRQQDIAGAVFEICRFYGFETTLDELWELIPYSFVVDWMVNTGSFVDYLDDNLNTRRFSFAQSVYSMKWKSDAIRFSAIDPNLRGYAVLSTYHRKRRLGLPDQPFDFKFQLPEDHLLEASSLLIVLNKWR